MRSHGALVPMTPEMLQQIFAEAEPDFSAQICEKATIGDPRGNTKCCQPQGLSKRREANSVI